MLQSIKIYAPTDAEGEQTINVIGNAYIEEAIKTLRLLILFLLSATSSTSCTEWATLMISTISETAVCVL